MCSTPKGSGRTRQVKPFVDDGADYASYSKMSRQASDSIDRRQREREAQKKRQAGIRECTEVVAKEKERGSSSVSANAEPKRASHRSMLSRLFSYLG